MLLTSKRCLVLLLPMGLDLRWTSTVLVLSSLQAVVEILLYILNLQCAFIDMVEEGFKTSKIVLEH